MAYLEIFSLNKSFNKQICKFMIGEKANLRRNLATHEVNGAEF